MEEDIFFWPAAQAAQAAQPVSIRGVYLGPSPNSKAGRHQGVARVWRDDGAVGAVAPPVNGGVEFVTVPLAQLAAAEPMDTVLISGITQTTGNDGRAYLNATTMRRVTPWRETLAAKDLGAEHVAMPAADEDVQYGPPFWLYTGRELYKTEPGLRRLVQWRADLTWSDRKTNKQQRRINVHMQQRQWQRIEELRAAPGPPILKCQMYIWDDQSRQLPGDGLTKDLDDWQALMAANPVPFYAMCRVNTDFGRDDTIALNALAVQWDLAAHLATPKCVPLPVDAVRKLIAKAENRAGARDGEIVNMSKSGVAPIGLGWAYYAMTSDPQRVTTPAQVMQAVGAKTDVVVLLALWTPPPPTKESDEPDNKRRRK